MKYWLSVQSFQAEHGLSDSDVWEVVRTGTVEVKQRDGELFLRVDPDNERFELWRQRKNELPSSVVSVAQLVDREELSIVRHALELAERSFSTVLSSQRELMQEKDERIRVLTTQVETLQARLKDESEKAPFSLDEAILDDSPFFDESSHQWV